MSLNKLGVFTSLALAAGAILIPPGIAATDLSTDAALQAFAIDPSRRSFALECSDCAVATLDGKILSWKGDAGNAFVSDLHLACPADDPRGVRAFRHPYPCWRRYVVMPSLCQQYLATRILTLFSCSTLQLVLTKTRSILTASKSTRLPSSSLCSPSMLFRSTLTAKMACLYALPDTSFISTAQRRSLKREWSCFP
jgi:hypothetical protein